MHIDILQELAAVELAELFKVFTHQSTFELRSITVSSGLKRVAHVIDNLVGFSRLSMSLSLQPTKLRN